MLEFIAVGLGGFIGCCLRYAITKLMMPVGAGFPYATLISNLLAGFLTGIILGIERDTDWIGPKAKLFLTTGIMGGLSTFSTFSAETVELFSAGKILYAAGNILLNVTLSLTGAALGFFTAKCILRRV